jgi:hypothetical protein
MHDPNQGAATNLLAAMMDIYVHKGKDAGSALAEWAGLASDPYGPNANLSVSDPKVSQSNDMDDKSRLPNGGSANPADWMRYPPNWNNTTKQYDLAANTALQQWYLDNGQTFTAADLATIAASMEVYEVDPLAAATTLGSIMEKYGITERDPKWILDHLFEDDGVTQYLYGDAFLDRSVRPQNSSDGGVIAGLSGYDNYDPDLNNWADQQVIRIDIDPATFIDSLGSGGEPITEIVIFDFGTDAGETPGANAMVDPTKIILNIDTTRSLADGQIYLDANDNDIFDAGDIAFPENRIYIAQVNITPEPATMILLGSGGLGLLLRKKRRQK